MDEAEHRNRVPLRFAVGGLVVLVTLVGLVGWAMSRPGSTSFYYTTSELVALGPSADAQPYRVHGVVVPGSIERDGLVSTFVIGDGRVDITVTTEQPLPDTLKAGSEVVARGSFDGDVFAATEVLAKCPSKFKARA